LGSGLVLVVDDVGGHLRTRAGDREDFEDSGQAAGAV
jgi:hypothetical protein